MPRLPPPVSTPANPAGVPKPGRMFVQVSRVKPPKLAGLAENIGLQRLGDQLQPPFEERLGLEIRRRPGSTEIGHSGMAGPSGQGAIATDEQTAVLQHRPLEPPLGTAHDLVAPTTRGGRLLMHDEIPGSPPVEAEEGVVPGGRGRCRGGAARRTPQHGLDVLLAEGFGHRSMQGVVQHLR